MFNFQESITYLHTIMSAMKKKTLFDQFNAVSAKAWKQKIQYDLKGLDYTDSLVWESPEGIKTKPFYHADDIEHFDFEVSNNNGSWKIAQEIYVSEAVKANKKAIDCLARGAESLVFTIPTKDIKIGLLLAQIDLERIPIYFNMHFLSASFVKKLHDFVGASKSNIHLNIDIIGNLTRTGNWFSNMDEDFKFLDAISDHGSFTSTLSVDACLYQNAGANIVQQLAYALSHANEYLNYCNDQKQIPKITFKIATGSNYFFEIAKIRALRLLWKTLANEYKTDVNCHIIAFPSKRNKTLYDYNVNLLRTTSECMSAVLGGADTICNLPYDTIYHKDNEFGERIARNQLLILKEEGYFNKVSNPSDGAYYIESLTKQLAEKALVLFKSVETNGGFLKQLKNHTLQRKIKESALKEQNLYDQNDEILVGSNAYQNTDDQMKNELELYPFVKKKQRKTLIEPIIEKRLAEEWEQQRLKNEQQH